ncbi:MAG: hypothetical protein WD425_13335 [Nitrospirales bacterium]
MNIFLCHSGIQSRKVAEALKPFIVTVLQRAKIFYSEEDIPQGVTWARKIIDNLGATSTGILCLTPENLHSTWMHFEAGMLFRESDKARIHGYLHKLDKADLTDPLSWFQNTLAKKEDTKKLVHDLNAEFPADEMVDQKILESLFEKFWPDLEKTLKNIPEGSVPKSSVQRPERELIEEILERVRKLSNMNMQIPGAFQKFFLHQIKSNRERQEELEEEERYRDALVDAQVEEWEERQKEQQEVEEEMRQEEWEERQRDDSP